MKSFLTSLLAKLFLVLYKYKFTILFFIYLLVIAFIPNRFAFSGSVVLSILSLLLLTNILAKVKIKYALLPTILFLFLVSLSAFFAFLYTSKVWTESLLSVLRTNVNEATDMGRVFLLWGTIIILVTVTLALLSQRELKKRRFPSLALSTILFSLYAFILLPFLVNRIIERIEFRDIRSSSVLNAKYTNLYAPVFYGNIVSSYAAITELNKIKKLLKLTTDRSNPIGIVHADSNSYSKRIVMVIGESSSLMYYSLYGYDKPTTPFLDSLYESGNTSMNHYDALSPAASTVLSLYRSMSFASMADASTALHTKSIVDLASDAGYKTYWISNQDPIGESNSEIGIISLAATHQYYMSNNNPEGLNLDINLVSQLKAIYKKEEKQFIVLHLMGSHIYYSSRFDEVDRLAIADVTSSAVSPNRVDDYDRSIHHTDRVLRGIYNILSADNSATMLYAPDHGEIVGLGHGYSKQYKEQFEIPFITFNFSEYKLHETLSGYIPTRTNRFNTINLSYVLSALMGYHVSDSVQMAAIVDSPYILLPSGDVALYDAVKGE